MTRVLQQRITGTGLPMVLLHGWGLNSGVFDHLLPLLSQQYSVHLIDLPGFGDNSDMPLGPLSDVARLIAANIPDESIVIGWSLGGLIAQQLALQHPAAVSRLVTIASTPHFMQDDEGWLGIAPNVLGMFEQQLAHDYKKTIQRFLAIQAMGSLSAKQDIHAIKHAIAAYPDPCEASLLTGLQLLQDVDLREQISAITQPTLRLYGRLDALIPHQVVPVIAELQPKAQHVVMEHVSHAPFISDKAATCAHILSFLSAHR